MQSQGITYLSLRHLDKKSEMKISMYKQPPEILRALPHMCAPSGPAFICNSVAAADGLALILAASRVAREAPLTVILPSAQIR